MRMPEGAQRKIPVLTAMRAPPHLQPRELLAQNETMPVHILGIESSCDETAAAVVADGREILSTVVASQIDVHRKYGGVGPELASREHLLQIVPVGREALEQAKMRRAAVGALGGTEGAGLGGALLVRI